MLDCVGVCWGRWLSVLLTTHPPSMYGSRGIPLSSCMGLSSRAGACDGTCGWLDDVEFGNGTIVWWHSPWFLRENKLVLVRDGDSLVEEVFLIN